ncbi:hypothetical protein U2A4042590067 [Corynebacterium striatum]|nr:hypothetical protein U2A4042590067 [Corynebacterium striatum]
MFATLGEANVSGDGLIFSLFWEINLGQLGVYCLFLCLGVSIAVFGLHHFLCLFCRWDRRTNYNIYGWRK